MLLPKPNKPKKHFTGFIDKDFTIAILLKGGVNPTKACADISSEDVERVKRHLRVVR